MSLHCRPVRTHNFLICVTVAVSIFELTSPRVDATGSPPAHATPAENPCEPQTEGKQIILSLAADKTSISFTCGLKKETVLSPPLNDQKFCASPSCDNPTLLSTLGADTKLTSASKEPQPSQQYTLTIPARKGPSQLYFTCSTPTNLVVGSALQENEEGPADPKPKPNTCVVKINVEAPKTQPPEPEDQSNDGGNAHPAGEKSTTVTQCKTGTVKANASPDSPLVFQCGDSMTLDPKPPKEVFDDHDGQCTKKVPLTDLVEAELQTLNEAEKKYTLTVKTAPVHDAVLCYKCVKETTPPQPTPDPSVEAAAKAVEHCMLKIAVKGTSDPSTSAAALLAVPSFFVWEFVLGSLRA